MALDGNHLAQANSLQSKCDNLAIAFNRCRLSQDDALQGYLTIFLPAAKYGLEATSIPPKHLEKAQSTIAQAVLPKMGYNRNMPISIVYGAAKYGGIGLQNLVTEQGLVHATFLISHLRANTDVYKHLIILLETYMLLAGTISSPLQYLTAYTYIQSPWIDTLRHFLRSIQATIITPNIQCIQILRLQDQAIMTLARLYTSNHKTLTIINNCRTWLQVNTIAEISNSDGTHLLHQAIVGSSDGMETPTLWIISKSQMHWPQQKRPDKPSWRIWKRFLDRITIASTNILKRPLGSWLPSWNQQRT
jgi:hypothetical protein